MDTTRILLFVYKLMKVRNDILCGYYQISLMTPILHDILVSMTPTEDRVISNQVYD